MNFENELDDCLYMAVCLRMLHAARAGVELGPPDALVPPIEEDEPWNSRPKSRALGRNATSEGKEEGLVDISRAVWDESSCLEDAEAVVIEQEAHEAEIPPRTVQGEAEERGQVERDTSDTSERELRKDGESEVNRVKSKVAVSQTLPRTANEGPRLLDFSVENQGHRKRQRPGIDVREPERYSDYFGLADSAAVRHTPRKRSRRGHFLRENSCAEIPIFPGQPGPSELTKLVMTLPQASNPSASSTGGHDKPLVLGRTKPIPQKNSETTPVMDAGKENALNQAIEANLQTNTESAAPADTTNTPKAEKKEKAAKPPKPSKASAPSAPLSPALIDLRVGHILRAVAHPNADSLYVSTIDMGDPEGAEFTQKDDETGKIVRTVCSGLNGLIPLEEMQDRKIVVVANLKPVNMRSIKSAAMVLAASPQPKEGADSHSHDRTVELVIPPAGSEAGDKVYFEGWAYGEGKGPEKQLNPKKKVWEALQPGFFTTDSLVVAFDASKSEMGSEGKGDLVVEGKGKCIVKTLKGAVVR